MKFIIATFVLLVAAVSAQAPADTPVVADPVVVAVDPERTILETIEKRAETLYTNTKKYIDDQTAANKSHLVAHLDYLNNLVDGIVLDTQDQLSDKTKVFSSSQVNVIEEDLRYIENSISDELKTIQAVIDGPTNPQGTTNTALITRGEALVKQGEEALVRHRDIREGRAIQFEITQIEALIKQLEAHPTGTILHIEEEQLSRHERTLAQLLERANWRNPFNPGQQGQPGRGGPQPGR